MTISVTSNPTVEWIAGQVTDAFPWDEAPRHLIRDRDGAYGPAYTRRIRAMGIRVSEFQIHFRDDSSLKRFWKDTSTLERAWGAKVDLNVTA